MYSVEFFTDELNLIKDANLRDAVKIVLADAPAWFWTAPASATGKYHPPDDNVEGGNCHHTKKVIWLAYRFATAFDLDTDIIVAAAHLHDIAKFGLEDEAERPPEMPSYNNHGKIAARFINLYANAEWDFDMKDKWQEVASIVMTHMGKFGKHMPMTNLQVLLHLADLAGSYQNLVALPFYDPAAAKPLVETIAERKYFLQDSDGKDVINFGKYTGKLLLEVVKDERGRSYLKWILTQDFPEEVKDTIHKFIEGDKSICQRLMGS